MPSFVKNIDELAKSVRAFMEAPEYWRQAIGTHPKYFVHVKGDSGPLFGLSKFCAFQEISLEDYVVDLRNTTKGETTQKYIKRLCNKGWLPLQETPLGLQNQFKKWFSATTGGKLSFDEIHLMTIYEKVRPKNSSTRAVSPEELQKRLATQTTIGQIGEEIAMLYEQERLTAQGAVNSKIDLERVSLLNTAAGFDIRSCFKRVTRYIEVKSSTSADGSIYVSPNEIATLQRHGESAFLYIVHVTDIEKREGVVTQVIRNPFKNGSSTDWLSPSLYTGKPPLGNPTKLGPIIY